MSEVRLIDANRLITELWKAMWKYEDKTEKQFLESDELDVGDWFSHRTFVQNMSDIDRDVVQKQPTVDAVPVPCYVGDEIWYVPDYNKKPFRAVCHCISIDKGGVRIHLYDMDGDNATYPARCVFKSKEDAERYCADGERRSDG